MTHFALNDLVVTGARKRVRDGVRATIMALALLALLGFALEIHRVSHSWSSADPNWGPPHAYLTDTGPWPVVVMIFLGLAQWWAHRSRMILGIVNAVASLAIGFLATGGYALVHLLSKVKHGVIGEVLLPLVLLALMGMCVVQIVVEPWAAIAERRAMMRAMPGLPSAIVVRSSR